MNIGEELITIFKALDTISVKGNDVYTMVGIRNVLEKILKNLKLEGGDKNNA